MNGDKALVSNGSLCIGFCGMILRKVDGKRRPLLFTACDRNGSSVKINKKLDDREP